jgi:hypothetical protein
MLTTFPMSIVTTVRLTLSGFIGARIISTLSLREASHFHFSALYSSWRGSGIFLLVRHRHGVPYLAPGFFAPWRNELDVGHSVLGIRRDHYGSHARGIVLPIAYLAILGVSPKGKSAGLSGWMFVWVLAPSLLISLAQQLAAFVGALASLFVSIFWITARYTCWLNHSTDPTLASGTAGAEHQARHP